MRPSALLAALDKATLVRVDVTIQKLALGPISPVPNSSREPTTFIEAGLGTTGLFTGPKSVAWSSSSSSVGHRRYLPRMMTILDQIGLLKRLKSERSLMHKSKSDHCWGVSRQMEIYQAGLAGKTPASAGLCR